MAIIPLDQAREQLTISNKKEKRIYEGLKEEEFIALLEHTNKEDHKVAFILGYGSGLRISEMLSLKPEDVDLKSNKMFIRQAKGSKDRIVNAPRWLREKHLKLLPLKMKSRALEKAFIRASYKAGINRIIGYRSNKAPINRFHIHSLRNSFATRALESGVPPNQVQLLMGHESLQTTTRYTKSNPTDAIQSIIDRGV
jgi:integrase